MATIKTTAKRNPITGDSVSGTPAYAKGRQTNFAGTDRKREPLTSGPGKGTTPVSKREARQSARALNKNLNEGIKKEGKTKQYYTGVPVAGKTRLESRMEKYGVESTPVKGRSASMQKKIDRNKIKMAKDRIKGEKRQERNANPTKFDTFVMKTLGKGKYDRGNMKRNVVEEGEGGLGYKSKQSKPPSCRGPK
jgi:hypothetical protein